VDQIVSPVLLFVCLIVGGLGVALALPRKGLNPQVVGALVAGLAFGVLFVTLGIRAARHDDLPNIFFYVFALIALGSGLRVVTHPKPVYSALYFILTILSSAALYLLLEAEFLAMALIIIYAGAILITYLFVIMLATQAPSEEDLEALSEYDAYSREPMVAAAVGVTVMVLVSFMFARGIGELRPNPQAQTGELLSQMPRKIDRALDHQGLFPALDRPSLTAIADHSVFDPGARTIRLTVRDADQLRTVLAKQKDAVVDGDLSSIKNGDTFTVELPDTVDVTSTEGVGFALIAAHPMALELAGVILLMAMVGAVVLARKQVDLSEAEKARMHRVLGQTEQIPEPGSAGAPGGVA